MDQASSLMRTRQARYKRDYDKALSKRVCPAVGDMVFLRKESYRKNEKRDKLRAKAEGPFPVVEVLDDGRTVRIEREKGVDELVSRDRVELSPVSSTGESQEDDVIQPRSLEYVLEK